MKKSELRQIIRKVLREADVVDKKYSAEGPEWMCIASCVGECFSMVYGFNPWCYNNCKRECLARKGIREADVVDKEYSAEGSLFWCKVGCSLLPGYGLPDYIRRYHQCVRRCKANRGIRESHY